MANEGWVKLYRKLMENPIVTKDADHLAIWIYLLLNATHDTYPALFKGKKIMLEPGQLLTGRKEISSRLCVTESKVQRVLNNFKSEHQIEQQTSNKNRLISIVNWDFYQGSEHQNERQMNNKRTTDEQQVNTNKNVKNDNNIYIVSKDTICQTQSVQRVVDEWNTLSEYGIKPISKLSNTSKRYQSLIARIKQYGVDDVIKAIDNIRHSDFLQGKVSGKRQWVITFDWFVLPNNFPKVLEGQYNNGGELSQNNKRDWSDWVNE